MIDGLLGNIGQGISNAFSNFGSPGQVPGMSDEERKYLQGQNIQSLGRMMLVLGMPMTAQQRAQATAQMVGNMPDPTQQMGRLQEMKARQMQMAQMQADLDWAKQNGLTQGGQAPAQSVQVPDAASGIQTAPAPQNADGAPLTPQQQAIAQPTSVPQQSRIPGITQDDIALINRTVPPSQRPAALKELALKRASETHEREIPMSEEERQAAGIPDGQPAFKKIKMYPSGQVEVTGYNIPNIQRPEDKFTGGLVQVYVDNAKNGFESASAAKATLNANNQMLEVLDDPAGIFSGSFAETKLKGSKYLKAAADFFGVPADQLGRTITNTETFKSSIANKVREMARALGSNPSNADREFALQVAGGQIELDENSIRRIIAQSNALERQKIESFNSSIDEIQKSPLTDTQKALLKPFIKPVTIPDYNLAPAQEAPAATSPQPPAQNGAQPPVAGARQAPDGHWYVPDPQRPGKYLRVD